MIDIDTLADDAWDQRRGELETPGLAVRCSCGWVGLPDEVLHLTTPHSDDRFPCCPDCLAPLGAAP